MIVRNQDVSKVVLEIPEGHHHIRTTIFFADGKELTFQEAMIANLVRGYVQIKTDPIRTKVVMVGRHVREGKEGYAEWQLLEET